MENSALICINFDKFVKLLYKKKTQLSVSPFLPVVFVSMNEATRTHD